MNLFLALLLVTSFPNASKTSWMSPQSFRLAIGMSRQAALQTLESSGWKLKQGRSEDEMFLDYSEDKALTLQFHKNRLRSVRFELFAMIPDVRSAFDEHKKLLRKQHGDPKSGINSKAVVVYDDRLPNIMVVLSDDPLSEYGKKGVGYLAVRYFDPAPPR